MPKFKLCPMCLRLHEDPKTACNTCIRIKDRERGTRQQRGLNADHDRFVAWMKVHKPSCACPGSCGYHEGATCGKPWGDPNNPIQAGHIVARSLGGGSHWANLRPECRRCNLAKGNS